MLSLLLLYFLMEAQWTNLMRIDFPCTLSWLWPLLCFLLEDFLMRLGRRAELAVGLDGAELEVVVTSVEVKQLLTGAKYAPFLYSWIAKKKSQNRGS